MFGTVTTPCAWLFIRLFLYFQLSFISTEAPTIIKSALHDVNEFCCKLEALKKQFNELELQSAKLFEKTEEFLQLGELKEKLELVDQHENERCYLECIKQVENLR